MLSIRNWLAVCLLALSPATFAATASEVVQVTADRIIQRINTERSRLQRDSTLLFGLVEELVVPKFDFRRMSAWVLGRNWREATEAEKTAFTEQFRVLLIRTYAKALLEYTDQPIQILGETPEPDGRTVTVRTQIVQRGAAPMDITYRMTQVGDDWKVVDVLVGGVSLVATYRGEFSARVREVGIPGLIASLTERNAQRLQ
jgi:phospholipid transport system substrate-binding protein